MSLTFRRARVQARLAYAGLVLRGGYLSSERKMSPAFGECRPFRTATYNLRGGGGIDFGVDGGLSRRLWENGGRSQ